MPDDTTERVCRVIAEAQRLPVGSIQPENTFSELQIDSLDGIQIIFALEEEFNINIPDEAARQFATVQEAINGVRQLLDQNPAETAGKS
jgi:acyl carrier protein